MMMLTDIDRSKSDSIKRQDIKNTTKTKMPINSYLELKTEINLVEDNAAKGEEISSAYPKITDDSAIKFGRNYQREDSRGKSAFA